MICALVDEPSRQILDKLGRTRSMNQTWSRTARIAWARITKSRKTIAELLLDQSVLAGVGNVYRCEVLFRHRIDPFTPGRELGRRLWDQLWADLVALLHLERPSRRSSPCRTRWTPPPSSSRMGRPLRSRDLTGAAR